MSLLSLTSSSDGLALNVLVGLPGSRMALLQAAGAPIPPPLHLRGVIDTGSDITGVASRVFQALALPVWLKGSTSTVTGVHAVNLFEVSLSIPAVPAASGPLLNRPTLAVMEMTQALPNIEVLIGRDVLSECLLLADGPGQRFTLAW
jgi:hypothetical protein